MVKCEYFHLWEIIKRNLINNLLHNIRTLIKISEIFAKSFLPDHLTYLICNESRGYSC